MIRALRSFEAIYGPKPTFLQREADVESDDERRKELFLKAALLAEEIGDPVNAFECYASLISTYRGHGNAPNADEIFEGGILVCAP